ncbi:peptidoglycan recognition protein [Kitasatospora sp. NPDC049258]|uniref:peptidoglycan recognition protein family protein n=1 Tax=Kitasatospora sp. NPDC049258 TaxID=3155394 RepID=UPI0034398AB6
MRFTYLASLAIGSTALLLLQPVAAGADAPPSQGRATPGGVTTLSLTAEQRSAVADHTLAAQSTKPFSMVGVSWDDPAAQLKGTVQVRTRAAGTGRWSGWLDLSTDADDRPDEPTGRGSTAPLWVGPSNGVAVRVRGEGHPLPTGLRVELVDPGNSPAADQGLPVAEGGAASADRALPSVDHPGPRPGIVTRSGWGADESIREPGFVYTGTVKAVFVHHTDTANNYACTDSAKIIRSIYLYHVQSNGWRDIGYNFLVDRCGTIFEGRAGGVIQPVLGAHTLGFNTDTSGVAAIGSFGSASAPQAQQDGIVKIAAWKLGLTDQDAAGSTTLVSASDGSRYKKGTSVGFKTISGHRDAFATECPGDTLYNSLGDIRTRAAHLQGR